MANPDRSLTSCLRCRTALAPPQRAIRGSGLHSLTDPEWEIHIVPDRKMTHVQEKQHQAECAPAWMHPYPPGEAPTGRGSRACPRGRPRGPTRRRGDEAVARPTAWLV